MLDSLLPIHSLDEFVLFCGWIIDFILISDVCGLLSSVSLLYVNQHSLAQG